MEGGGGGEGQVEDEALVLRKVWRCDKAIFCPLKSLTPSPSLLPSLNILPPPLHTAGLCQAEASRVDAGCCRA